MCNKKCKRKCDCECVYSCDPSTHALYLCGCERKSTYQSDDNFAGWKRHKPHWRTAPYAWMADDSIPRVFGSDDDW